MTQFKTIDLRSDTLTIPDREMLEPILSAPLGDDGRIDAHGRGEDPTVAALEHLAATLTGKEAAALFCSGTLANMTAILTHCAPGDKVLVDEHLHAYRSEGGAFDQGLGQRIPVFYPMTEAFLPDMEAIGRLAEQKQPKLLCIENTHNFYGGICIPAEHLAALRQTADMYRIPIHMDGARIFNAAEALGTSVKELCSYADSVMFCISKGLGAPVGSLLCGTAEFIQKAKSLRKMLGGGMRQAGVIAAPGIYALEHNVERLKYDRLRAQSLGKILDSSLKYIRVQKNIQSNIIMLHTGRIPADELCRKMEQKGVIGGAVGNDMVRLVIYKGITDQDIEDAAGRIAEAERETVKITV
ncbi:MAG: aminotransferase class I/II-fold pyridoxal phosphate-dependent enzyme [Clostridium sp.]|nr:aminotransferase class I/II-fold pyridoxal phosphate-dependent enzyme [Clostridium sp.]